MDYSTNRNNENSMTVTIRNERITLDVEENLGSGVFGTVVRAVDNRGVSFAVKAVVCNDMDTYASTAQEVEILLTLTHPYIVAMYAYDFLNNTAVLIMEYCSQGTLNERLDRPVDIMIQLQWMEQLRNALAYLHDKDIVHRDLKAENVLLSGNNDVKIADFGIARHFVCCRRGRMDYDSNAYISEYLDAFMGTFAGTPYWIAPEVFDHHYTEKADIFSLGVIFYSICERQYIIYDGKKYYGAFTNYKGINTGIGLVMFEKQQQIQLEFYQNQSKILQSTIYSMTHINPENRISLMDISNAINESYIEVLQVDVTGDNMQDTRHYVDNLQIDIVEDEKEQDKTHLIDKQHIGKRRNDNLIKITKNEQCESGRKDYIGELQLNVIDDAEDSALYLERNRCTCSFFRLLICCGRCTCGAKDFM